LLAHPIAQVDLTVRDVDRAHLINVHGITKKADFLFIKGNAC